MKKRGCGIRWIDERMNGWTSLLCMTSCRLSHWLVRAVLAAFYVRATALSTCISQISSNFKGFKLGNSSNLVHFKQISEGGSLRNCKKIVHFSTFSKRFPYALLFNEFIRVFTWVLCCVTAPLCREIAHFVSAKRNRSNYRHRWWRQAFSKMDERMNDWGGWTDERMNENGWTDERMNDWVDERMNDWVDERMNDWGGWTDERKWMNGWTYFYFYLTQTHYESSIVVE